MFSVLFEVHPKAGAFDTYLGYARMLRPELEKIDGFVDNTRYRSLTREGWVLSLSSWRDEKALVRWRVQAVHHGVQAKGRADVFSDYHLRVGQVTADTTHSDLPEQRLDETQTGAGTDVVLIDAKRPADPAAEPDAVATWLGLRPQAAGLVSWDVFEAVLTPGDMILLTSWRGPAAAEAFARKAVLPPKARLRRIRVVRDYGMFDRREAPQYFPDVARS